MSEKNRRWFQIHLSTAIVLMFAAGLLLWANCTKVVYRDNYFAQGWPFSFYVYGRFLPAVIFFNAMFGAIILGLVAFLCEVRSRRLSFGWILLSLGIYTFFSCVFLFFLIQFLDPWADVRQLK